MLSTEITDWQAYFKIKKEEDEKRDQERKRTAKRDGMINKLKGKRR